MERNLPQTKRMMLSGSDKNSPSVGKIPKKRKKGQKEEPRYNETLADDYQKRWKVKKGHLLVRQLPKAPHQVGSP